MLVYKENETLKQENRMLREKVGILSQENENLARSRGDPEELDRLNRALQDRDVMAERDIS